LENYADKPWAQEYLPLDIKNFVKKDPYGFLKYFSSF
jgi:hypothetical protein